MPKKRYFDPTERVKPEYNSWRGMIQRCHNPNDGGYSTYGGSGIEVCARWRGDYFTFLDDMGRKPSRYHSLDRIDSTKDYSPDNCRWANFKQQGRNKKNSKFLIIDGVTKNLSAWSEQSGVCYTTIKGRLDYGWTPKDAVFTVPTICHRFLTVDGVTKSLTDWSREYGIDYTTVISRLRKGMDHKEALSTPTGKHDGYKTELPPILSIKMSKRAVKAVMRREIESFLVKDGNGNRWKVCLNSDGEFQLSRRI